MLRCDKIWTNAKLVTYSESVDNTYGIVENGAIGVADGRINLIIATDKLDDIAVSANEIIDIKGRLITPGFIDCHTHLVFTGDRSKEFEMRLEGKSYEEILKKGGGILATVNATRQASFEELYNESALRLNNLMHEGVTTVEIKSGYGLDLDNEIKMLKIAKKLEEKFPVSVKKTFLAHIIPEEYKNNREEYAEKICHEMIPEISRLRLADAVDVFCENIAFNLKETETIFKCANEYGFNIKIHAEQMSSSGAAKLAAKYSALSADHLEYLEESGVEEMAISHTVATLLPGAFYFLKEKQKPPVELFRKNMVDMAIATDINPGTSPFVSILLIINMACVLFGLTPYESLKGVTINAAKALGIADKTGSLDIGKDADFVIWDVRAPAMLAYQYGINPLIQVIKEGETILCMKDL